MVREKLTYEIIKERYLMCGYMLLEDTYVKDSIPMICKDSYGYKYKLRYSYIRTAIKNNKYNDSDKVSKYNPYSIENIKLYLKINNINLKLISDEYIDNNTNMTWECSCGKQFYSTWSSINCGKYVCNDCSRNNIKDKQKKSYNDVKNEIERKGCKLLTNNYINNNQLLDIQCSCGNIFKQTYGRIHYGKKCKCDNCSEKELIERNRIKYIETYFKNKICPCNVCNEECCGINKCNIIKVYKYRENIEYDKQKWSESEIYKLIKQLSIKTDVIVLDDILYLFNNKNIEDLTYMIGDVLHFNSNKNKLMVRKHCSVCGKEVLRKPYMYDCKYVYCSDECKNKQSNIMIKNGDIKQTKTIPHKAICDLLKSNNIYYEEEYNLKYHNIDIYCNNDNIPIEIMGDYWHANPLKYDINTVNDIQKKDIKQDKSKHTYVKKYLNKEILYLWECDIKEDIDKCNKLIQLYISNDGILDNYQSYNYYIDSNGSVRLNNEILNPYFIN